jgi:V8-like Glu-specific endopeptidase
MRSWRIAAALAVAVAATPAGAGPAPVIGGSNAPSGKWPDAAAILYQVNGTDGMECSGVLVAPTVVLTAGHCDPQVSPGIGTLDHVLLGTNSLADPGAGEIVAVARTIPYPDSQNTVDLTAIVLSQPAREAPRKIATGWARLDITNGAAVEIVGYGAIDSGGNQYVDQLQQAQTTITDFDCTTSPGCNTGAQPDGELGAGGMGVDACPGDSGGPLYLMTSYGAFLAGTTSRAYSNATLACSQGGIYERPDKVIAWLESATGVTVAHGPEPTASAITATRGDAGETTVEPHDPVGKQHTFAITTPPAHGMAAIRADGRVRVCTDASATGSDSMVVTITDETTPARALALTIPITIEDGTPPASCDVMAFSEGGGCCDAGRDPRGSVALAAFVAILMRRRRSQR